MHYSHWQPLPVWILLTLFFSAALVLPETQDMWQPVDTKVEEISEEYENALLTNVRDSYRNGFVELMNFVNSINNTFPALKADFISQTAEISRQNKDIAVLKSENALPKADVAGFKSKIAGQEEEIRRQKAEILGLNSESARQKAEIVGLKSENAHQNAEIFRAKPYIDHLEAEKNRRMEEAKKVFCAWFNNC